MRYGDANDQDPIFGRPLAPDDRLWRHPSEVGATARIVAAQRARRRKIRLFSSLVVAGVAIGVVTTQTSWGIPATTRATQQALVSASRPAAQSTTTLLSHDLWASEVVADARASTAVVQSVNGTHALAGAISLGAEGYLVTSGRALGDATTFLVHAADGTIAEATLVGYDPTTDLSVLKTDLVVSTAQLASVPAADGDTVAILDPTGEALRQIVTSEAASTEAIDGDTLIGLVSLDASLHNLPPGSPIIDASGSVVGISTATAPGAAMAIVPIDIAREIALALIEYGEVNYARLGVTAQPPRQRVFGARISDVDEESPAGLGGIEAGDLLIQIEDDEVVSVASMVAVLRRYEPGDVVDVLVEREGELVSCIVELGDSHKLDVEDDDDGERTEDPNDGETGTDETGKGRSKPEAQSHDALAELRQRFLQ